MKKTSCDINDMLSDSSQVEIGSYASWYLSSCKPGHGVDQLLDNDTETFWQSDGPQPHFVTVQFPRKTTISYIMLYCNLSQDESYTPNRLAIRVGSCVNDLVELLEVSITNACSWQRIALRYPDGSRVRAHMLQVVILANHQSGRDTHLRSLRIFSPRTDCGLDAYTPLTMRGCVGDFSTTIR